MSDQINVPISPGELVDKITILEIKRVKSSIYTLRNNLSIIEQKVNNVIELKDKKKFKKKTFRKRKFYKKAK